MTLKGKKNHFNVKLLSGYGLSVRLKNSKIILKNGYDPFSDKQETEEWYITKFPYEKIVISGTGYVSIDAITLLCNHYKNVIIVDTFGKPIAFINGMMESLTATKYRMAQYDTFRDESKCKELARKTISDKLDSQIRFIQSLKRDDSEKIITRLTENKKLLDSVDPSKIEATSANLYFRYYATLFDERLGFSSRNNSNRITKRNATDPINSLLNYGYSVLAGEISKFVNGFGLDAYCGFMHSTHTGFQPLVYDIMESFRWMVESAVYHIANTPDTKRKIRFKDFAHTKDGLVVLSYKVKKDFLEKLERIFQNKREIKYKFGRTKSNGMTNCQEITIVKIEIENLVNHICNNT